MVGDTSYEPFGASTQTGEAFPFQFTGRSKVSEGLYYYRARFYDPDSGRFVSEDPIGFSGGDVNLYRYVGNDPVNFVDPAGKIPLIAIPLACAASLGCSATFLAGVNFTLTVLIGIQESNEIDRSQPDLQVQAQAFSAFAGNTVGNLSMQGVGIGNPAGSVGTFLLSADELVGGACQVRDAFFDVVGCISSESCRDTVSESVKPRYKRVSP